MTLRHQYAADTRNAIIAAARKLFAERGYTKTRIEDIASMAGVAAVTVYSSVGGKSGILRALVDTWTGSPIRNEAAQRIELSVDPVNILEIAAETIRCMREQFADIIYAIHDAATFDAAAEENLKIATARYRGSCMMIAQKLETLKALKQDLSAEQARDILWMYFGYWSWYTLHNENGWSYAESEQWLLQAAKTALLHS